MSKIVASTLMAVSFCIATAQAGAAGQNSYVPCDNGLRCVVAPCPSTSALDLATGMVVKGIWVDIDGLSQQDKALNLPDKLYAGKLVVAGTIENRPQSFNGKQYSLPTLIVTGIERTAKDSERKHCSSR